jgi:predicted DNA-binding transcriptional regulator AlpA
LTGVLTGEARSWPRRTAALLRLNISEQSPLRTSKQTAQPRVLESNILRPSDVLARYQISLPTLFRWIRQKKLPRPFKLVSGGRLVGWYESDLAEFEARRRAP